MKRFSLLLSALLPFCMQAQWSDISESTLKVSPQSREIHAHSYRLLALDKAFLQADLADVPQEQSLISLRKSPKQLILPMPNGEMATFAIAEAPVMHPDLARKYPEIKTYIGVGLSDAYAHLRFDVTPAGFHAMVLSPEGSYFIDPYTNESSEHYMSYFKKDFYTNKSFECDFDGLQIEEDFSSEKVMAGDCQFRKYRLALSCTGEYAAKFGGTVNGALAAMVTSVNRVTGVYEKEIASRLELIANTDTLIFLNASTDPFTNNNGSTMLNQNQTTVTARIGSANYDIGHVFSTGGGGIAILASVCNSSFKAMGVTGSTTPSGDPFDIDYVAHEMGHQFGGNHTFHATTASCSGNRNLPTAYEPGSGTSIMAYAGICSAINNVANHSDAYFHAASLYEIMTNLSSGIGGTCAQIIGNANQAPVAQSVVTGYTLPIQTPFILSGTASDPDGDPITYCWEQWDNQSSTQPPVNTSTGGPLFRTRNPRTNGNREIPLMSTIANGTVSKWETLPAVSRTCNFRMTVRDNSINGGCTDEMNATFTFTASAGPFKVLYPNDILSWNQGDIQTITWDVANTTGAGVNCQIVDIFLSTDNGVTYPNQLANDVPNNGSYTITVPNTPTNIARVMVRSADNIFFDISDQSFYITAYPTELEENVEKEIQLYPNPASDQLSLALGKLYEEVAISIWDVNGKVISAQKFTSVESIELAINEFAAGIYALQVQIGDKQYNHKFVKE